MADWWNPVSWDWGGAGHWVQNNPASVAADQGMKGLFEGLGVNRYDDHGNERGWGDMFVSGNHGKGEETFRIGVPVASGNFGSGVAPGSSGITDFSGTTAAQSGGSSTSLLPSPGGGGPSVSFGGAPSVSFGPGLGGASSGTGQGQGGTQMEGLEGLLAQIARQQMGYIEADRATRDNLMAGLAGTTNPYSGSALQQALALQSGSIQRGFNNAADQTRQSLARRGALGTAQETSAMRQIELDRARALSGSEAATRTDYASRAADFGQRQYGLQAGLLGMSGGSNPASIFQSLLGRQDSREYQDSQSQSQFWGNIGALIPTAATIGYDVWKKSQEGR